MKDPRNLLGEWYRALQSDIGIILNTDDRRLLRDQLYRARADSCDEDLKQLTIAFVENPNEVWIVWKDANDR